MMIVPSLSPLGLIESSEFSANDKKQFLKSSSYSLVVELQRVRVNEGKMASAADTKLEINAAFLGQVQSNFCFFFLDELYGPGRGCIRASFKRANGVRRGISSRATE